MSNVTLTVGIQGSGKSTWAQSQVDASNGNAVRVNRDTIRLNMFGPDYKFTKAREQAVMTERDRLIITAVAAGRDVIVDDMNLSTRHINHITQLVRKFNTTVTERWFDDSLDFDLCVKRIAKRVREGGANMPHSAIEESHRLYVKRHAHERLQLPWPVVNPAATQRAIMVDIDGTIATMTGRRPFEWHRVGEDQPNMFVLDTVLALTNIRNGHIVFMSGRDAVCRTETEQWLKRHFGLMIPYDLFMRTERDQRPDWIVKREMYMSHVYPRYQITHVFDDRQAVVRMWNAIGLNVLQVHNPGMSNDF